MTVDLSRWTRIETKKNGTQDLCNKILQEYMDAGRLFFWRSNAAFVKGLVVNFAGCPDFTCLVRGQYLGIECKGFEGKGLKYPTHLNDNQKSALPKLARHGIVIIIHDPADLAPCLDHFITHGSLLNALVTRVLPTGRAEAIHKYSNSAILDASALGTNAVDSAEKMVQHEQK